MKKILCGILLTMFTLTASGCQLFIPKNYRAKTDTSTISPSTPDPEESETPFEIPNSSDSEPDEAGTAYKIEDYYPFLADTVYTYEGMGSEFAANTLSVDYIKGNKIQQRIKNSGTELVRIIEKVNGELKIIFSREECYYREDLTSKQPNREEILLKEPLVKGNSWTLDAGRKRTITNVNIDVSTPSGNYKALEVTTEGSNSKTIDYYVLNKGLVKSVFRSDSLEIISSLKEIETNKPLTQKINFYYPNNVSDKLSVIQQEVTFNTNDITKIVLEKQFKNPPSNELIRLMAPKVKINSLYLNNDGMVYVDFTDNFVTEMNLGSGYEGMVLQGIANTLGKYYGIKKVYITLDGKPYSSGHIIMEKGEAFNVELELD
ncbi:GerMN domain-containing protein [Clostridium thermarum]|uniref:GerMN domain-containing protein n=1 Tax=Clostridium thermarum TaxID=1716543 RepID=UPI0013D2848C|nr:GerMN domain-containing protein [Clostridium thermarum]